MSAEASPRPWRVNGHSIEANDPDGLWLQNEKTGWGVVANLPSCPKSRMSKKNRSTWDAIVEANAALIVAAVNLHEYLIEHNKLNAEKVCELFEERDRLRDAIRYVCNTARHALGYLDAVAPREAFMSIAPSDLRNILEIARAALGEDSP